MFRIYEKSLRIFAAIFIFIYGAVKPWQFADAFEGQDNPVNELDGMSLMWAFFGYSITVPIFVGFFECVGAVLLFIDRTKLFGALLLLPVLANIVLFDIVYQVTSFATMNGVIYLAVILFVCFVERKKLAESFGLLLCETELARSKFSIGRVIAMVGFLALNWVLFLVIQGLSRGLFSQG